MNIPGLKAEKLPVALRYVPQRKGVVHSRGHRIDRPREVKENSCGDQIPVAAAATIGRLTASGTCRWARFASAAGRLDAPLRFQGRVTYRTSGF